MNIGEKLKRLRTNLGLSQVEVAEKAKITKQTLYKYENNIVTNIPLDNIETLAKILGVSPGYIMGWEDHEQAFNKRIMAYASKLMNLSDENRMLVETMIDKLNKGDN